MTTVAWDGTTLAADRCGWSSGVRRAARKVFKVKRGGRTFLVAFMGSGDFAVAVLHWMRGEWTEPPSWRDYIKDEDRDRQCALVIDERRRVWQLSYQLVYTESPGERVYAMGAGQEFAWGALEAGATAKRAIQIAAKRSDYAGLGVDTVVF